METVLGSAVNNILWKVVGLTKKILKNVEAFLKNICSFLGQIINIIVLNNQFLFSP